MVEGKIGDLKENYRNVFQSAVRIAVWLKEVGPDLLPDLLPVSIRRADRCLVEGQRLIVTGRNT